jgi:hypothetical protein
LNVRKIAALILASAAGALCAAAPATSSSTLVSNAPWWERITVTLGGDGNPQSCRYETSLATPPGECDVDATPAAASAASKSDADGKVTSITFERRFTPDAPAKPELKAGDTLLGGQIMALAIDARGSVSDCRIVARSGSVRPQYGCDDATAERFEASVGGARKAPDRAGYMTIIVYGHAEHMV